MSSAKPHQQEGVYLFSNFYDFILSQPFYFAIPLWIIFGILSILATIGGYAVFSGFCKNVENLEKDFGFTEKGALMLLIPSYLALIIYVITE